MEQLITMAGGPVPAHIPAALAYDFDISKDALFGEGQHLAMIELSRRTPGIFFTPRYGGHWVARSQEAVTDILQNHELFSSNPQTSFGFRKMLPIHMDPPDHRDYRKVLLQVFAPKTVNTMLPLVRELAVELIGNVAATGRCEFISDIAEKLPVTVFMKLLGIPLDMMAVLRVKVLEVLKEGNPTKREQIFNVLEDMLTPIIEERMAERQEDVISRMIDADLGGRKPTLKELQNYVVFLASAGLDTVTNAMGYTAHHLATHLDLQAQIRAEPKLIPEMIEEMLRRYAVSSIARYVTRDVDYRGVPFRKGERVHILLPAANLDGEVYENPGDFVIGRTAPPITFGTGVHRCLGSHLARLELRTLFEELFRQIPTFTLDADKPPLETAGLVYGFAHLNLAWPVAA